MQIRSRFACLSAAVLATLHGAHAAMAADLIYDPTHSSTGGSDATGGLWDNTSLNWYNPLLTTNPVAFSSATPDSATFGTSFTGTTAAAPFNVILSDNVTVQNITLQTSPSGTSYNIVDLQDNAETLTVKGNIIKAGIPTSLNAANLSPQFNLSNAIMLSAGNHIIATRDSPGDSFPELTFNSAIAGAGGITIDNSLNYAGAAADIQYGTTAFNTDNTYAGNTSIVNGRLVANSSGALGAGSVTISAAGALAFAGAGTSTGDLTIANDFTISRSDYATANTNNRYQDAIVANNDGSKNTITLNGVITVNSTDARITANTNTIVINKPLVAGATGAASVLDLSGDFFGFVTLAADNSAYGNALGAIELRNGVEVNASTEGNLGGPGSKLILAGGTIRPTGALGLNTSAFMTNFGGHALGTTPVNTGLNLATGQVFNVNGLGGGAIGTRGTGTINFNGANVFTGKPFFDGGFVNINDNTTFGGFAIRSAVLTIAPNVTKITTTSTANEAITIAQDGTDASTLNIASNMTLANAGGLAIGDAATAKGAVNNAGILTVGNETWIGNGGGTGTFTQTAGSMTANNWFAVGRDVRGGGINGSVGSTGVVNLSGGSITKTGGGNSYLGENVNSDGTVFGRGTMTLSNNASFTVAAGGGEFWIGQAGGQGLLTIQDTASFTVNNWLALGRANGASVGTINLNGGTLTKVVGSNGYLAIGSGGTGTLNQTGGVLNADGTRLGEASNGAMNLSGGTATFTGEFSLGAGNTAIGTLTVSNTANVTVPTAIYGNIPNNGTTAAGGTINLNGGTLTSTSPSTAIGGFYAGTGTGARLFNFNGGTLSTTTDQGNLIGAKVTSTVLGGGAIVNSNGHAITINSALLHGGTAASDGGLIASGAGTLTLTGANTYTGTTVVNNAAGTLAVNYAATGTSASSPLLTGPNGADIQNGSVVFNYSGSTTPAATVRSALQASYATHFASGQLRSTTNVNTPSRALGYADNGTSTVTVRETYFGDATLDGKVDVSDLGVLATNYGATTTGVWSQGDFDYNGKIDVSDLGLLATYYGSGSTLSPSLIAAQFKADLAYVEQENPAFAAAIGNSPLAVPEPASLAAIAVGSIGLFGRRRRRMAVSR